MSLDGDGGLLHVLRVGSSTRRLQLVRPDSELMEVDRVTEVTFPTGVPPHHPPSTLSTFSSYSLTIIAIK